MIRTRKFGAFLGAIVPAFFLVPVHASTLEERAAFDPGRVSFSVKVRDEISPYRIQSAFVMPGEVLSIEIIGAKDGSTYSITHERGASRRQDKLRWTWTAPDKPGNCPVRIARQETREIVILNAIVLVPLTRMKGEYLNGYRVGRYPSTPLGQLPIYRPPKGLIEVTESNLETFLSPHFQLKQFLCKQEGGFPKYLILRERLLIKLEMILGEVNRRGICCETLYIFSGYRTPYYNRIIGNGAYSRHIYGGAADIFVDSAPADGIMDDLNRDGRIDMKDADVLYRIIADLHKRPGLRRYVGGLAKYPNTSTHGPFVHTDVRGYSASW